MTTQLENQRALPVIGPSVRFDELVLFDRVHSRVYNDEAIFEEEFQKIFSRRWVFIAHDSEVPNPGDDVARKIGRQPVIISRGLVSEVRIQKFQFAYEQARV